jgi:hypothetical protein
MVPIGFTMVTMAGAVALFLFIFLVAMAIRWRRHQVLVDMDAVLADEKLREYVLAKQGRAARRRYRLLTGVSLREARLRVNELIASPELLDVQKKKRPEVEAVPGEGVRNLIAEGRIDEAVDVYRDFMGVDKFTAEQAVLEMQRELRLSDGVSGDEESAPVEAAQRQEKSRWE